jgi:spermidine/putrescine ABC transporter ATP-binding subunit
MPEVRLVEITKRYGKVTAVDGLTLTIEDREMLTLLGPSGCGKTTTLRCIAGFVIPDSGQIFIGAQDVTRTPPEKRDIGFVFQNYALWPHMTVYQNIAFGLRLRKLPKQEIKKRVHEALDLVRLTGLEDRYPRQLSGGQQQRVALARALVLHPRVLLLDEPLSNLDAKLREEMRFEIRELQRQLKITAVYVTHDQSEALVLSDRIAVLNQGRIEQLGTPEEIYQRPVNKFIANFIGLCSFIECQVIEHESGHTVMQTEDGLKFYVKHTDVVPGQKVVLAIRPEAIEVSLQETQERMNTFRGQITRFAYLGENTDCRLRIGKWDLRVRFPAAQSLTPGQWVWIYLAPDKLIILPA